MGGDTEDRLREVTVGAPRRLDGRVVLVDHDPAWADRHEHVAGRVRAALGERVRLLEHVGSTAVPGLAAKPVVDVVLEVDDAAAEPAWLPDLERAGFVLHVREPDWHEHRLLHDGARRDDEPEVNLHVFSHGCPETARMLAFRDHLRRHPDARAEYEATKRRLAARRWDFVQDYADAKSAVVESLLARAGRDATDG